MRFQWITIVLIVKILASWCAFFGMGIALAEDRTIRTTSPLKVHFVHGQPECSELLDANGFTMRKLADWQAKQMGGRRQDFGKSFLASRGDVAYEYWKNSIAMYTQQPNGELASTLAISYSTYDEKNLRDKTYLKLPMEKYFGELPRPIDPKTGKGIIFEVRMYGMLKPFRRDAFAAMYKEYIRLVHELMGDSKEMYHQKVIHTYGGLEGINLYVRGWDYELINEDRPTLITDDDGQTRPNWRMQASPETTEKKLETLPNLLEVSGIDRPLVFPTSEIYGSIGAAPRSTSLFLNRQGARNYVSHVSALRERPRGFEYLGHDIWGASGTGAIVTNDRVVYVEKLGKPHEITCFNEPGKPVKLVYAMADHALGLGPDHLPMVIGAIDRSYIFYHKLYAAKGSRVEWSFDHKKLFIHRLAFDHFDKNGKTIRASHGGVIEFDGQGKVKNVRERNPILDSFDEDFHKMITVPFERQPN